MRRGQLLTEQRSVQPRSSTAGRDSTCSVYMWFAAAPFSDGRQHRHHKLTTVSRPCSVQLRLGSSQADGAIAVLSRDEPPFSALDVNSAADQQQQVPAFAHAAADTAVAPAVTGAADAAILLAAAAQTTLSSPDDADVAMVQQNPARGPVTSPERSVADGWARAAAGSPRHPDSAPPRLGMPMGEYETPRPQKAGSAELRPGSSVKRIWFPFSSKTKPHRCAIHPCGCA